jgi:hypothetical protein
MGIKNARRCLQPVASQTDDNGKYVVDMSENRFLSGTQPSRRKRQESRAMKMGPPPRRATRYWGPPGS